MKLELKHITPYLPYSLEYLHKGEILDLEVINPIAKYIRLYRKDRSNFYLIQTNEDEFKEAKPILRPLSDLTKEFSENNLRQGLAFDLTEEKVEFIKHSPIGQLKYWQILYLLSHNFDIFGLIEQGLAINKNEI